MFKVLYGQITTVVDNILLCYTVNFATILNKTVVDFTVVEVVVVVIILFVAVVGF